MKAHQLQVNNGGAWKTIIRFDAGNEDISDQVIKAAETLQQIDAKSRFRVATCGATQDVLMYLDGLKWRIS